MKQTKVLFRATTYTLNKIIRLSHFYPLLALKLSTMKNTREIFLFYIKFYIIYVNNELLNFIKEKEYLLIEENLYNR